jgi:ketosteroid isomerase-like protein
MALAVRVTLRGVTRDQYDAVRAQAGWVAQPPAGGLAHITWWEGDDCHNLDAWESEAAFQAFGEQRLAPAMAAAGVAVEPEITMHAAHEVLAPRATVVAPTMSPVITPTDNVSLLRRGYEAFARGDVPAVLQMFDASIDWYSPDTIRNGGRFTGPAAVAGFFSTLPQLYSELAVEPRTFLDHGDTVAVLGIHRGRSLAGTAFELPWVHVWTFSNGKATSFTEHFDTTKLNAALGIVAQRTPESAGASV